jgi:hypothetical protein
MFHNQKIKIFLKGSITIGVTIGESKQQNNNKWRNQVAK